MGLDGTRSRSPRCCEESPLKLYGCCDGPVGVCGFLAPSWAGGSYLKESCFVCMGAVGVGLLWDSRLLKLDMNERTISRLLSAIASHMILFSERELTSISGRHLGGLEV